MLSPDSCVLLFLNVEHVGMLMEMIHEKIEWKITKVKSCRKLKKNGIQNKSKELSIRRSKNASSIVTKGCDRVWVG